MTETTTATSIPDDPTGARTSVSTLRATIWAAAGFAAGATITAAGRAAIGSDDVVSFGPVMVVGYTFALVGWLFGIGLWDVAGRQWFGRETIAYRARGWRRYFGFHTDHKVIGIQYGVTFVLLLLLAGALALTMRTELMEPGRTIMGPAGYNRVMSLHGFTMVLVAITALPGTFGNYILPIMLGAEDMAFPRLNALSFWFWPPVAVLLGTSLLAQGWDSGWTGYAPLSTVNQNGQLLYQLAFITAGLSSIVGAVNFIVTIKGMRAPGMTWRRLPIFAWSMLATAILSLLFTQSVAVVMTMSILDRLGFGFFNPAVGGDVLAYQHIFWFYSHPAVYVMILPALGVMLEVIAHFARKPVFAYTWAVVGFLGITVLSAVVWAHHMFTSGMQPEALKAAFMATTEAISVPTGLVFLSALGTLWRGRIRLQTPALFALAVVFNFLIGGVTGVYLSDVPVDIQLQDTYWVVAHFHYTIVGGGIFGLFAAIYFWYPKMTGRMFSETLGRWHFWLMFLGFNATFLPMFWLGANGMNRRIADYTPNLGSVNLFVSLAAFVLGASFLPFIWNMIVSARRGTVAGDNPWRARTLEWQTSSPPPELNFLHAPEVLSGPYDYGEATPMPHGVVGPAGSSPAIEQAPSVQPGRLQE